MPRPAYVMVHLELCNSNLWPLTFELKIDTPVTPSPRNVHTNFGFSTPFVFELGWLLNIVGPKHVLGWHAGVYWWLLVVHIYRRMARLSCSGWLVTYGSGWMLTDNYRHIMLCTVYVCALKVQIDLSVDFQSTEVETVPLCGFMWCSKYSAHKC